jgi:hypothetical protein
MSNTKKSKKNRTPNVPKVGVRLAPPSASAAPAPTAPSAAARARTPGGLTLRSARPAATAPAEFDYTYIRQDLRRIAILAGSFIVVLVGLSFIIR